MKAIAILPVAYWGAIAAIENPHRHYGYDLGAGNVRAGLAIDFESNR